MAHGLASDALIHSWTNLQLEEKIGDTVMCDGFEVEITEEMTDAVQIYVDEVRKHFTPECEIIIEEKTHLKDVHDTLFGTPDTIIIHPFKSIKVFDYKHGAGKKVNAWENKQLMYYALGYAKEDVEEITINIVQPRIDADEPVSSYTVTPQALEEFAAELKEKAAAALLPDAPRNAGDWCHSTFCPLMHSCPAVESKAREIVAKDFGAPPAVESLSVTQIKHILDYSDFISKWLGKVRDHAKERMVKGEQIPGYKLVQSLGHRKWISDEAVESDFGDKFGDKIYVAPKLKSPAQLEKIIGKDALADYTMRPENGYNLVTESAKGEPVKLTTAAEDFDV